MIKTGYAQCHSYVEQKKIRALELGILDQEEILRMSVANLHSERIYDEETYLPKLYGINDPRTGLMTKE